jgi:hypothetical protein
MRLVPTPPAEQSRSLMMLDDAEMALQMNDLTGEVVISEPRRVPASVRPAAPMQLNDFLTELYAAAGMIMDRSECDALAKEMLARHELVIAA